ncbi:MAG: hypothetical protein KGJ13_03620, partial [Patescibacteria group bacterium]|nr:hypothetical protein [Patescibacteria group bacterium]
MSTYSKTQEEFFIQNIRRLVVIQHDMSLREMQRQLEENGIHLHVDYINRLRKRIFRERLTRVDRQLLNEELAAFEDTLDETTKMAWQILFSNQATRKERIAAMKEIREARKDLFDKKFDAGVFDRKLGVVEHEPKLPLTMEQRAQLIETMIRWGIIQSTEAHGELKAPKDADAH